MLSATAYTQAVEAKPAKTNDFANVEPAPVVFDVVCIEPANTVYIVPTATVEPVAYVETKTERSFFHSIKDYNYVSFVSATRPEEANVGWRRFNI